MTALTAATAMAINNIEPENLLRMMDLPLRCSMLLFAVNSRQLRFLAWQHCETRPPAPPTAAPATRPAKPPRQPQDELSPSHPSSSEPLHGQAVAVGAAWEPAGAQGDSARLLELEDELVDRHRGARGQRVALSSGSRVPLRPLTSRFLVEYVGTLIVDMLANPPLAARPTDPAQQHQKFRLRRDTGGAKTTAVTGVASY
jgi:hypothetical protein